MVNLISYSCYELKARIIDVWVIRVKMSLAGQWEKNRDHIKGLKLRRMDSYLVGAAVDEAP